MTKKSNGCNWFGARVLRAIDRAKEERRIRQIVDYRYAMAHPSRMVSGTLEFFKGSRRWGFMFGSLVFKFPILTSFVGMLSGFREQLEERYLWHVNDGSGRWNYPHLNRIIWGDRFGFIQISERCSPVIDEPNFDHDLKVMKSMFDIEGKRYALDCYMRNFGYTQDGRLVFIDYGYFGGTGDCYLGVPHGFSIVRTLGKLWGKLDKFVRERSGRRYGVLICRIEENDQVVPEKTLFDLGRRHAHDVESVRSALVNHISTETSRGAG